MWEYVYADTSPYELYHYGIHGQKWGIRRYQNPDGTLTDAGKKRYWGDGGDYTKVGRKRYIKDLVKDYNEINGTNVKLSKAVVRVGGKYYNGKGVELDPRDLSIVNEQKSEPKPAPKPEIKPEPKLLNANSLKKDFDSKPISQMTSEELRLAKEYYERLNGYEKAGAEYAKNHISKKDLASAERRRMFGEIGRKFVTVIAEGASRAAGESVGKWIKDKIAASQGPRKLSESEMLDLEKKRLTVEKLRREAGNVNFTMNID